MTQNSSPRKNCLLRSHLSGNITPWEPVLALTPRKKHLNAKPVKFPLVADCHTPRIILLII